MWYKLRRDVWSHQKKWKSDKSRCWFSEWLLYMFYYARICDWTWTWILMRCSCSGLRAVDACVGGGAAGPAGRRRVRHPRHHHRGRGQAGPGGWVEPSPALPVPWRSAVQDPDLRGNPSQMLPLTRTVTMVTTKMHLLTNRWRTKR